MKSSLQLGALVLLGLGLVGCSNDNGSPDFNDNNDNGSSDFNQVRPVDFTDFVKSEIDNTADDRDPVSINNLEFTFNDKDNEQAYDELF